ncbi:hypothetical protein BDV96DRAFT_46524 [Lophiotrema nucula]|uniref:Uncharacterized protein n=1 Tax=Lophiotrema nucula TaxID=690887 RepID=A0A6A5Z9W2_9PLEO|nr:hypothetical protein BDV96DRAFT_46524 [Lophiotrema nucula]
MIITGKYIYKKVKKHREAKAADQAADSENHDDLVKAGQDGIAQTPVDRLQDIPPPRYSSIEHSPSSSPSTPEPPHPSSSLEQQSILPVQSPGMLATSSIYTQPSHSTYMHPQTTYSHSDVVMPSEIPVRGKWVWVEDAAPLAFTSPAPARSHAPEMKYSLATLPEHESQGFVAELPISADPVEVDGEEVEREAMTHTKTQGNVYEMDTEPMVPNIT